jgi:hypothetical protein
LFIYVDLIEGHEPSQTAVRILDEGLPEFIEEMVKDGRTVLVLVSDHGIGDRGKSPSVRVEERLPLSMLVVPPSLTTGLFDCLAFSRFNFFCAPIIFLSFNEIWTSGLVFLPIREMQFSFVFIGSFLSRVSGMLRAGLTLNQKRVFSALNMFETVARIPRRYATGDELIGDPNVRPWSIPLWANLPENRCLEAGVGLHACACSQYGLEDTSRAPLRWL